MTEKDKSTVLLEHYLKKLKIPTMLREYAAVASVCQKDRSDFRSICCARQKGSFWTGRNGLPKGASKTPISP